LENQLNKIKSTFATENSLKLFEEETMKKIKDLKASTEKSLEQIIDNLNIADVTNIKIF